VAERTQTGDVCREAPAQNARRPPDPPNRERGGPAAAISDHDRGIGVAGLSRMAATDSLTISRESCGLGLVRLNEIDEW
jgi:hypothetical protein